jgi:outer membrane protein
MKSLLRNALIAAVVGLSAPLCRADDSLGAMPPNEVRVGGYFVFYNMSAQDLYGQYVVPGLSATIKNVQTPYFAFEHYLPWHLSLELTLGVPPLTQIYGKGPATVGSVPFNNQELLTARWFAPSMLLNYTLLDDSHRLRPYVGVGVTYVNFYDRQITPGAEAVVGGPTRVSLTSSIGPTATLGLSYRVAHHWSVYASYSLSRVRTLLTTDTAGVYRFSHVSFAPGALVISAGYAF